jgi:glutathione reductase (NADPH)
VKEEEVIQKAETEPEPEVEKVVVEDVKPVVPFEEVAQEFDYLVIGAGSGGVGSGRYAAATYGTKVCIIENRVIGGTCVNVGCVPKKVMFNLANFLEEAHLFKGYGVSGTEGLKLDYATFKGKRDAYVNKLNGVYHKMLKDNSVTYVEGTASFVDPQTVECEGKHYKAKHILIASGSYPTTPRFEGSEHCMNSDDFFTMTELPESMAVIGGGYIGVELAQIMQALGVKVTLIVRSQILRFLDEDVRE